MGRLAVNGGTPVRTAPWPGWPVRDEREVELVTQVVRSGKWAGDGPMESEFAARFAAFSGASHGVCVANGTVALQVALEAAGVRSGDEVLVPALTWIATASAVLAVNAVPVFVDIDPDTYCIDTEAAEGAITERARAIIPVHLSCVVADMDAVRALARRRNLVVIEDASHSHGSQWRCADGTVRGAGAIGDLGAFSLQASKVLNAGEGGVILTSDARLAERCYSFKNCGRRRTPDADKVLGYNFRISELQAALLLAGLERLEEQLAKREENVRYLSAALHDIPGIHPLWRDPRITRQSYYGYTFRYDQEAFGGAPKRNFLRALNEEGIPAGGGYDGGRPVYLMDLWHVDRRRYPFAGRLDPTSPDYRQPVCPVADTLPLAQKVDLPQRLLLGSQPDMQDIIGAIHKIREHADELLAAREPVATH